MGGLLDATNIISTTVLEVLTSISMDHMELFGGIHLPKIAEQKAGIIKPHTSVVSAKQELEAERVIREVCDRQECSLRSVDPEAIKMSIMDAGRRAFHIRLDGCENIACRKLSDMECVTCSGSSLGIAADGIQSYRSSRSGMGCKRPLGVAVLRLFRRSRTSSWMVHTIRRQHRHFAIRFRSIFRVVGCIMYSECFRIRIIRRS